jgi:hypothetical protein
VLKEIKKEITEKKCVREWLHNIGVCLKSVLESVTVALLLLLLLSAI